jgi:hypothetical protein
MAVGRKIVNVMDGDIKINKIIHSRSTIEWLKLPTDPE